MHGDQSHRARGSERAVPLLGQPRALGISTALGLRNESSLNFVKMLCGCGEGSLSSVRHDCVTLETERRKNEFVAPQLVLQFSNSIQLSFPPSATKAASG